MIAAVVIGLIIASALFISKVGKSIVKRQYTGEQIHSRKMRNKAEVDMLAKIGGEIAFLGGSCRSAGIWADEDADVLRLPYDNFLRLQSECPEIAVKIIRNIAVELSHRLRRTSNQVRLLEDQ